MKNKLKIISLVALGALIFTTCQKDPKLPMPDLQTGVIPVVKKSKAKDQNISFLNLDGFSARVTVNTYYKDKPESMDLMVSMNNEADNTAVVKSDITSFPDSADVTIANLVDILPGLTNKSQIQLGDFFKFYVDMTLKDGTVINGNDTSYASFNTSIANLPGSSLNVTYTVACPLDYALTTGSYYSYSAPSEWASAGNITLTADAVDHNKILVTGIETIEGLTEDKGPLVMHINPLTYDVTADKSVIASNAFGYHNIAYAGTGTYDTCTGTYTMSFNITVDEGNFGTFVFSFTRN